MKRATFALLLLMTSPAIAGGSGYWDEGRRENTVRVAVPIFEGGNVGHSVATILNLQIFETLRVPPYGRPNTGEVLQCPPIPKDFDTEDDGPDAQLVLWGNAFEYAGSTVVQTYLRVNESEDAFTRWPITIEFKGKTYPFEVSLPSSDYVFDPIVLPSADVRKYAALSALKIYADPAGKQVRGLLGKNDFRAVGKAGPPHEALEIEYRDAKHFPHRGYILVPQLTSMRSEIVDFTSALVRVMRQDWMGAIEYLDRTIDPAQTPPAIRLDAYLLRALCNAKLRRPWSYDAARASEINPHLDTNVRYGLMLRVAAVEAVLGRGDARPAIEDLASFVRTRCRYLERTDPLLVSVERFLNDHASRVRFVESTHK